MASHDELLKVIAKIGEAIAVGLKKDAKSHMQRAEVALNTFSFDQTVPELRTLTHEYLNACLQCCGSTDWNRDWGNAANQFSSLELVVNNHFAS